MTWPRWRGRIRAWFKEGLYGLLPFAEAVSHQAYWKQKHESLFSDSPSQSDLDRLNSLLDRVTSEIGSSSAEVILESANEVKDAESSRFSALDSKAAGYLLGVGVSVSLLALVVNSPPPNPWRAAVLVFPAFHLFSSALCALLTKRVQPIMIPTLRQAILFGPRMSDAKVRGSLHLARIMWNEPILNAKASWLQAAERHFVWGIFGIIAAVFVLLDVT